MMLWQIVDEGGDARLHLFDKRLDRIALAAAAANDAERHPGCDQLPGPRILMFGADIGQDDDIRDGRQPFEPLARAGYRILPVHLMAEKTVEQRPDFHRLQRRAAAFALERIGEGRIFECEVDVVIVGQPGAEWHYHVHQHFVAIGDQQGAGHIYPVVSAAVAATISVGEQSSAPAQAIRSGSWLARNSPVAANIAGSVARARNSGASSPVRSRSRWPRMSSAHTHARAPSSSTSGSIGSGAGGRFGSIGGQVNQLFTRFVSSRPLAYEAAMSKHRTNSGTRGSIQQ